jgi:hypothetical protein
VPKRFVERLDLERELERCVFLVRTIEDAIGKSKRLAKIRARIRADLPHAATLPLHGHEVAVNRGDT